MKKLITFFNRTKEQIAISLSRLRNRYKSVKVWYYQHNGWYNGHFSVEGNGKRNLKWK